MFDTTTYVSDNPDLFDLFAVVVRYALPVLVLGSDPTLVRCIAAGHTVATTTHTSAT